MSAGSRLPAGAATDEFGRVRLPVRFSGGTFELLRKRAAREGSCINDVVVEIVERAFGG